MRSWAGAFGPQGLPSPLNLPQSHDPGPEAVGGLFGACRLLLAAQVRAARGGMGAVWAIAGLAAGHLADDADVAVVEVGIVVVVGADVARHLGFFALVVIGLQHGGLDHFAAGGVDRVSDIGVELGPAVSVADGAVFIKLVSALVAVAGPQVILAATAAAAVGQFAAGHGHKRPLGSLDDFQVANHVGVVECH